MESSRGEKGGLLIYERGYSKGAVCCAVLEKVMRSSQELVYTFRKEASNEWDGKVTRTRLHRMLEGRTSDHYTV